MTEIIHIYSSNEELEEMFEEAIQALDRALELYMIMEKQCSASKYMAKKVYNLIILAEDIQEGMTIESLEDYDDE